MESNSIYLWRHGANTTLCLIALVFIISGCTPVKGNKVAATTSFTSAALPPLNINIPPGYDYIGESRDTPDDWSLTAGISSRHLYVKKNASNTISSFISLEFYQLSESRRWAKYTFAKSLNDISLAGGTAYISGEKYVTAMYLYPFRDWRASRDVQPSIRQTRLCSNCDFPQRTIAKMYIFQHDSMKAIITYAEAFSEDADPTNSFINQFDKRADKYIQATNSKRYSR